MKIVVVAILSAAGLSAGQTPDCGESLSRVMSCMRPAFDQVLGAMPLAKPPSEQELQQKKDTFVACFTDNGCQDPTTAVEGLLEALEADGGEEKGGGRLPPEMQQIVQRLQQIGVFGVDGGKLQKVMAASAKCSEKVKDMTKPAMSKCIGQTVPALQNFEFPEPPFKEMLRSVGMPLLSEDMSGFDGILQLFGLLGKLGQIIMKQGALSSKAVFAGDVCPAGSRQAAAACLSAQFDARLPEELRCANPFDHGAFLMRTKATLCAKRDECKGKEDARCEQLADQLGKAMCRCAGGILENKWEQVIGAMSKCVSDELGEDIALPDAVKDRLKSIVLRSVKRACAEGGRPKVDPCADDVHPMELARLFAAGAGRGRGGGRGGGGGGGRPRPPLPMSEDGRGPPPLPGNGPPPPLPKRR